MDDIDELQASLLRTLASAHRLRILHLLGERPCEVNEIAHELGMSQAAASQHLGAMRGAGPRGGDPRRSQRQLPGRRPPDPLGVRPDARTSSSVACRGSATSPPRVSEATAVYRLQQSGRPLMSDNLSIVLFSGTDDKLHAAATIAAGAAAMGTPVSVLLMYWALDAFRADRIDNDHGLAYDASRPRWNEPVEHVGDIPWLETFRQAKELGDVTIRACSGIARDARPRRRRAGPAGRRRRRHRVLPRRRPKAARSSSSERRTAPPATRSHAMPVTRKSS